MRWSPRLSRASSGRPANSRASSSDRSCAGRGQRKVLHPAVSLVHPALQQTTGLEAIHHACDVGRVTVEALRQLAHGHGVTQLDEEPGLRAGEPELGRDGVVVGFHLPGQGEDQRRGLHFQLVLR